jgi:hypothetical protein
MQPPQCEVIKMQVNLQKREERMEEEEVEVRPKINH